MEIKTFFLLNPYPRILFFIDFGERDIDVREEHQLIVSIRALTGSNLKPGYVL